MREVTKDIIVLVALRASSGRPSACSRGATRRKLAELQIHDPIRPHRVSLSGGDGCAMCRRGSWQSILECTYSSSNTGPRLSTGVTGGANNLQQVPGTFAVPPEEVGSSWPIGIFRPCSAPPRFGRTSSGADCAGMDIWYRRGEDPSSPTVITVQLQLQLQRQAVVEAEQSQSRERRMHRRRPGLAGCFGTQEGIRARRWARVGRGIAAMHFNALTTPSIIHGATEFTSQESQTERERARERE